jgi:hypothetical protein
LTQARAALRARLEARRPEIEQAILARVYGISDPSNDPAYLESLRASVLVALDYAFEAIERGEERAPPPPPSLLAQARMAARSSVGLDTVLRRYVAGYTLIGDFLAGEAASLGPGKGTSPAQVLRGRAAILDRLLAAVSEEYEREAATRNCSNEQRRSERLQRLLAGEPLDTAEFEYEFEAHHTAAVAKGPRAAESLRELAVALDRRLLLVHRDERTCWAWLGARRPLDPERVEQRMQAGWPPDLTVALGEPAEGHSGWRLTHRQATAALPVAERRGECLVRYADVALLAAATQDDLLATSLHRLYLDPLQHDSDRGGHARHTLRAYFAAERNITSAANALGVDRKTVRTRLRALESALGRPLTTCASELETALALEEMERAPEVTP